VHGIFEIEEERCGEVIEDPIVAFHKDLDVKDSIVNYAFHILI